MVKQDKTNKDVATDPKTDVVVQHETTPETENKNETQEIHSDSKQSTIETVGSGQTEGIADTRVDSESEATAIGTHGGETGGEAVDQSTVNENSDDTETAFAKLDPETKEKLANVLTESLRKAWGKLDVPAEPKEKTAQRERIALDVFSNNNNRSVLYFTADLIPFFEKSDAIKHIQGLDDKTIVTVNKG